MPHQYNRRKSALAQLFDFSDVHPPRDSTPAPDTRDHDDLFYQGLITKEEWHRREFYPPEKPQMVNDNSESHTDGAGSENSYWDPTGPTADPCDIFNEHHRHLHRLAAAGFIWPPHLPAVAPWEPTWDSATTYACNAVDLTMDISDDDPGSSSSPLNHMGELSQALPVVAETDNTLEDFDSLGLLNIFRTRSRPLGQLMIRNNLSDIDPYDFALVCPLRDQYGYPCQAGLLSQHEFENHLFSDHMKSSPWVCMLPMPPTSQLCEQEFTFCDYPKSLENLQGPAGLRAILRHICTFRHRQLLFGCRIQRSSDGTWTPVGEIGPMPLLRCKYCSESWNSLLWGCQNSLRQHIREKHPDQLV